MPLCSRGREKREKGIRFPIILCSLKGGMPKLHATKRPDIFAPILMQLQWESTYIFPLTASAKEEKFRLESGMVKHAVPLVVVLQSHLGSLFRGIKTVL